MIETFFDMGKTTDGNINPSNRFWSAKEQMSGVPGHDSAL